MNKVNEAWVSVEAVAKHLQIKSCTIYKWLERKQMPGQKVGRLWRFKLSEIDNWVKTNANNKRNRARKNS